MRDLEPASGTNIVVKFVVPGGDPRFYITLPKGRQAWLAGAGVTTRGKHYSVNVEALGGRAPLHWTISSGKLPAGLALNPATGNISGTPTTKGTVTFAVKASDSREATQSRKPQRPHDRQIVSGAAGARRCRVRNGYVSAGLPADDIPTA